MCNTNRPNHNLFPMCCSCSVYRLISAAILTSVISCFPRSMGEASKLGFMILEKYHSSRNACLNFNRYLQVKRVHMQGTDHELSYWLTMSNIEAEIVASLDPTLTIHL